MKIGKRWRFSSILLICVALFLGSGCADAARSGVRGQALVATYHPEATRAAVDLLRRGGSAADAFIAAVMVEFVVSPGVTTPAGELGALVYDSAGRKSAYIDGSYRMIADPAGAWSSVSPLPGKAVLVPGAISALWELWRRYGRLPWSELLESAIAAARDGFEVTQLYSAEVALSTAVLSSSDYGAHTFLPGGKPVAQGSLLVLPELANFLAQLAAEGASYAYQGEFARAIVDAVGTTGGRMTLDDLASYQATWREPFHVTYRDFDLLAPSGRSIGGPYLLLTLKALEGLDLRAMGHPSTSASALEAFVRVARTVWGEPWLIDARSLEDQALVAAMLSPEHAHDVLVRSGAAAIGSTPPPASGHSYHVVVIDRDGNAVTGTHTIEGFAFGSGIFVQGVPLNASGSITFYATRPGELTLSPLSMSLAFAGDRLVEASGTFSYSLEEAGPQIVSNILDFGLRATEALSQPRFGTFPFSPVAIPIVADVTKNWLDPRVSPDIVQTLMTHGLQFQQSGYVDTGLATMITAAPDGSLEGEFAAGLLENGLVAGP